MNPTNAPLVTAAVLTRNEEAHLPDCLDTLRWAHEIVVLDSGSTDRTVQIAAGFGARVATHPFENYSRQRQHALSLVATPWVLFVDADERIPPGLATEIAGTVESTECVAFWIPRRNLFWGRSLRGGGWWPDEQLRLLRVGRCSFDPDRAVHELARVRGPVGHLHKSMVHLNYDDWTEFRAKQTEYADLEAVRRVAAGEIPRPHNYLLQPVREFWRRYFTLGGWRDGPTGLALAAAMAWYELVTIRMSAGKARDV